MAELDLELEKSFLVEKTRCSEDAAWNFLIAEEEFFEKKEAEGADLGAVDEEELYSYISEKSGISAELAAKLGEAELLFFSKNGID
ncbi:MAG: hypothetical protein KIG62_09060 [Oscillospiraceae bacterium]|nr:hypothetical protein [Oscillospiraceae bacterium]